MAANAGTVSARNRRVESELQLVAEAIALVARGGARRVVVAGLRFGRQELAPARRMSQAAGVRVVPLDAVDGRTVDLAFERPAAA